MLSRTVGWITGLTMDIVLTDEREPYTFGDKIAGKLVINNGDPALKCYYVKIRLNGLLVIRCDNKGATLTDTVFNKQFPVIETEEITFWNQAEDGLGPLRMFFPQGVTEFPFTFDTSNYLNCPPSHESGKGAVRWFLDAEFHRPLNFDVVTKHSFRIVPSVPLNDPLFVQPLKKNEQLLITAFLGSKQRGNIEAVLQIDRQGFLPGQAAHVIATFNNQCEDEVTLKNMAIKILQNTQCTETSSRTGTATAVVFNQDIRSQPMATRKGNQCTVKVDIIIPQAVPCFQHPNINVTYSMNLYVQTSTGNLEVSCPFFLGNSASTAQSPQSGAAQPQPAAAPVQDPPPSQEAAPVQDPPPSQEAAAVQPPPSSQGDAAAAAP